MIPIAKTNYFREKDMECGKDQNGLYQVIHSLEGRNRAAILPTSGTSIDATEEFS